MLKIAPLRGKSELFSLENIESHSVDDTATAGSAKLASMCRRDATRMLIVRFASHTLLSAFAFALIAPAALARDLDYVYMDAYDNISWGTHPWDVRPRRNYEGGKINVSRYSKNYFYLHPDRSQTHALHPYHRGNYYDPPVDPERARYSLLTRSRVQYAEEYAYSPERHPLSRCLNYSYSRPNYRIPPYQYFCQ